MAKNWNEMAVRLRSNQDRNLRDYAKQNEKNEKRIQALGELQNSQDAALRARRGRH